MSFAWKPWLGLCVIVVIFGIQNFLEDLVDIINDDIAVRMIGFEGICRWHIPFNCPFGLGKAGVFKAYAKII